MTNFIERLLCARYCSRLWEYRSLKMKVKIPCLYGVYMLADFQEGKQMLALERSLWLGCWRKGWRGVRLEVVQSLLGYMFFHQELSFPFILQLYLFCNPLPPTDLTFYPGGSQHCRRKCLKYSYCKKINIYIVATTY